MRPNNTLDLNKGQQHRRLGELNRLIHSTWQTSSELAAKARLIANQAVTERILFGGYLNELKDICPDWELWLEAKRPKISQDEAREAMHIASHADAIDFTNAASVLTAYRICGVVPRRTPPVRNLLQGGASQGG